MSRQVAVVGLAVVILAITLIPITAANGPGPSTGATHGVVSSADGSGVIDGNTQPADDQSSLSQFASERFDRTVFSIEVFENASARWTFRYTHVFGENDTERESFEDFAAEFRGNETALYREFVAGAEGLATTGSNVTDRPMNATAFSRDARTGTLGNTGVVEMSFTWTNFGQQSDGAGVRVSDIFEGGIYIRSDQRLRFVAGPNLAFERADPAPRTRRHRRFPKASGSPGRASERSPIDARKSRSAPFERRTVRRLSGPMARRATVSERRSITATSRTAVRTEYPTEGRRIERLLPPATPRREPGCY